METNTAIAIENLPEECDCGSKKGIIERCAIEMPDGKLVMEVSCKGCGKIFLIPDQGAEKIRKQMSKEYHPTWYYDPETSDIIHWADKK